MNPNEIKAAIALSGTTQTAIARSLGVSLTSVQRVIAKSMRSQRIEKALEEITGSPVNTAPPQTGGRKKSVWNGVAA